MERFVKGDIVVIPFPFSNLSGAKKRPALVLADLQGEDIILCQITSQITRDKYAIPIDDNDYRSYNINVLNNIRPTRIYSLDKNNIIKKVAIINVSDLKSE